MKRELGAFAFFLLLAIAITWPLVLHLDTAVADRGDPLLTAWILDWVDYSALHAPLDMYDAPIYHPGRYPLAYSENLIGIAVLMLPLHLAGLSPLAIQNIALILGFAFSAYGMFVLARLITRNVAASLIAGIFFAFCSFMLTHIQHIQIVWSGWLPLILAALLVYWRRPTTKQAALLGAAFVMNGLTNVYWLIYGGFIIVLTIAFLALAEPRRDRAFWLRLAAALLIAGIILVPFLLPYQLVANEYGDARRTTGESRGGSASLIDWLVPTARNAIYGSLAAPDLHRAERELFPGLLPVFLAIIAFAWRRGAAGSQPADGLRAQHSTILDIAIAVSAVFTYLTLVQDRVTLGKLSFSGADVPAMLTIVLLIIRFFPQLRSAIRASRFTAEELTAGMWIIVGFIASLGWNSFLHPFLFRTIGIFRATRTPARWAIIVYIGLAVWAAMGAAALLNRTKRSRIVAAVIIVLAVLEVLPNFQWDHLNPRIAPVYQWLAREKPGVILELPIIAHGVPYEYILASTAHRVPMINGASGWETPLHGFLRTKEEKLEYDDAFLDAVLKNDCAIVIVHEQRLTPERKAALAPMLRRLTPLHRFGSDAVFRTPRIPAGSASAPREAPPR